MTNAGRSDDLSCRPACSVSGNLVDSAHVRREIAHVGRGIRTALTRVQLARLRPRTALVDGAGVPREAEFGGKHFRAFVAGERALHVHRLDVGGDAVGGDELLAAVVALEVAVVFGVELEVPLEDSSPAENVLRADAATKGAVEDVRMANMMAEEVRVWCRILLAQITPAK